MAIPMISGFIIFQRMNFVKFDKVDLQINFLNFISFTDILPTDIPFLLIEAFTFVTAIVISRKF